MKRHVVRFGSLLVFDVVVLLVIGWLTPARVGWSALWAGVVVTALAIWVKPLVTSWFRKRAAGSAGERTKAGELLVQGALTFVVALLVWIATVLLSGVRVHGWFWGYVLPPVILLIGWAIYDLVDHRIEGHASVLYDKAAAGLGAKPEASAAPAPEAARRELHDGLTDEQRRMFDELGGS